MIEDNYRQYGIVQNAKNNNGANETIEVIDTVSVFDTETMEESVRIVKSQIPVLKTPELMPVFGDCHEINDLDSKYECSNKNLLTFIYSNLTYPKEAKDAGVEGMNVVQFIVAPSGNIMNPKIVKSIGHGTNEVIMSVMDEMTKKPMWTSGRQEGQNVATQFTLPIKFKLEG